MDPYDQLPGQDPVTVSDRVTTPRTRRYLVIAGVLAGGVTLGAMFTPVGLASALQSGSGSLAAQSDGSTPTTQAGGSTSGTDASGADSTDKPAGAGKGDHHGRGGHHGFFGAADDLAAVLGLSSEDLWSQVAEGKSLGEIADAQGVSRDTAVDTLTKGLADHLADEVAEGDLTQSEADTRLAEAKDAVASMIDKGWGDWAGGWGKGGGMADGWRMGGGMGHDHGGLGLGRGADLQGLADSLGIDLNQLRTDVMAGKTVAEAAEAQGVSADDLKNALVTEATKHIDQALADGRIDQAKADELKAGLDARIDDLINGKAGDLGGHGGWGGGGMGHGWGGGPMGGGHHGDGTSNGDNSGGSGSGGGDTQPSSFQA